MNKMQIIFRVMVRARRKGYGAITMIGAEYDHYPTHEEIMEAFDTVKKDKLVTYVYSAHIEKRFILDESERKAQ